MEFDAYLLALGLRNLLQKNDDQDQLIAEMLLFTVSSMKLDIPTSFQKM